MFVVVNISNVSVRLFRMMNWEDYECFERIFFIVVVWWR